jgi:uncharacterized protein YraI
MSYVKSFAVAGAALGLTATAALARPAVSETDLNVRSGPGTNYRVVGVLQQGEGLDAGPCSGNWCRVNFSGGSGWASASYLSFGGSVGYAAPPAVVYDEPYYDYYAAPGFSYGYSHRWRGHRRHGRWHGRPGHHGRWSGRGGGRQDAGGRGPSRGGAAFRGSRGGGDGNVGVRGGGRGGASAGRGGGGGRGGGNVGAGPSGGQDRR